MAIAKPYEDQLAKLGFSEKEAKVYIASLEIGAAPVQKIAESAGVKRATTYVMIESLMNRGLMGTFQKGKKTYFVAENPKRLQLMLSEEQKNVDDKKQVLDGLLGDLLAFGKSAGEHAGVAFFEGAEGLTSVQQEILNSRCDEILNIVSLDDARRIGVDEKGAESLRNKMKTRKTKVRTLYTTAASESLEPKPRPGWERRRISDKRFPIHGELIIFGDKVAAFSYRGKIFASVIESKEIARTFTALFDLAWDNKKLQ